MRLCKYTSPRAPRTARAICAACWLRAARGAPALVVLGDLFEYWIGPAQERSAGAERVFAGLAALAAQGTSIELLCGNRDFLLSQRAAERAGARLHPEGLVGELPGGRRALVLHGDTLCTLDVGYQRLRRVLRSAPVQVLGPRLPALLGSALARRLRRASSRAKAGKPLEELALQPEAGLEHLTGLRERALEGNADLNDEALVRRALPLT